MCFTLCQPLCLAMPSGEELLQGVDHQTASQAVHTAERARLQAEEAPGQRSANQKATETFRTTWVKKELVRIQVTKITFDLEMIWGPTRARSEDAVLQCMASSKTNPPCRPISSFLIRRDEGTCLPHSRESRHLGTAVPTSFVFPQFLASCVPLFSQRNCHTALVAPISSQPSNASIGSIVPIHKCYRTGSITCTAKKSSMSALLTSERVLEWTTM